MATIFQYSRGATIQIALQAPAADPATIASVTSVTASLKRTIDISSNAGSIPDQSVAPAAAFTVTSSGEDDPLGLGWIMTLTADVSATLAPGYYVANASIAFADFIQKTDPLFLLIVESVA